MFVWYQAAQRKARSEQGRVKMGRDYGNEGRGRGRRAHVGDDE
ncbi:MAG: hypothetical protein OIN83_09270 [Candidatus Methanoperedens sp.]|nr:hypothetical protein [Candidatus Methanoperedens sp.]